MIELASYAICAWGLAGSVSGAWGNTITIIKLPRVITMRMQLINACGQKLLVEYIVILYTTGGLIIHHPCCWLHRGSYRTEWGALSTMHELLISKPTVFVKWSLDVHLHVFHPLITSITISWTFKINVSLSYEREGRYMTLVVLVN